MTATLFRTAGALGVLGLVAWALLPDTAALAALSDPQRAVDTLGADVVALVIAQLLVVALCGWTALTVLACAVCAYRPASSAARVSLALTPRSLRRPIAVALGIGTLALAACGQGERPASVPPSTAPAYVASSEAFDWPREAETTEPPASPSVEAPEAPAVPAPTEPGPSAPATSYDVRPGDSLWSIARAHLDTGATAAQIAYLVDEIYAASAAAIGSDPDLLRVGTTVTIPAHSS